MITDEQVRIALQVWFQDEGYEPSAHTLCEMRATLEAVVGSAPVAPGPDAEGFHTVQWKREHPVHGTLFIGRLLVTGRFSASRVFEAPGEETGLGHDSLGTEHATFADAQASVSRRIAELDAQLASAETLPLHEVAQ